MKITFLIKSSSQAIRIRSAVAGEFKEKVPVSPDSILADLMASLIAKNTLEAKNRGGSPTAYAINNEICDFLIRNQQHSSEYYFGGINGVRIGTTTQE